MRLPRYKRLTIELALARLKRREARNKLRTIADEITSRSFSVHPKRVPGVLRKQRVFIYERSTPAEIKQVEGLLKEANPRLNRKTRRHLARKHRFVFQAI